ncbi:acetylxylan esterase [Streptomyces sp. NEAU-sy36]|uniref:acetylxylan esterase n=1 Tax=unclassified Streptomyces TaxID=2593676 RepID=UPI0015D572EC|nr:MULTISPECIES: acetylxylan esterase [unclassified Streptomyces]QLJ00544.1 acetylxylan esterase [Streptomyces sp. NEAU-sy36]
MPGDELGRFWHATLTEATELPLDIQLTAVSTPLAGCDVYDVSFAGAHGHRVAAWLILPGGRAADGPAPCTVQFLGYGEGRGHVLDSVLWPALGYATLVVDTRGQSGAGGRAGATPDPVGLTHPQVPGFVTRGILDPATYYYRDAYVDAVRAVAVAAGHPGVDVGRIATTGRSQGGQLALAAAVLSPLVGAALVESPFLAALPDPTRVPDRQPYRELLRFAESYPDLVPRAARTLALFDVAELAAYGRCPALFSVAGRDQRCLPETGYAAHARYPAPKRLLTWPLAEHAAPNTPLRLAEAEFLAGVFAQAAPPAPAFWQEGHDR